MLIDLHAHTWPRSHDSVLNPDDLVVRAKQAGLDAICFTEHDTVWDQQSIDELRAKHDFLVLSGVEISTDDGHIIIEHEDRDFEATDELVKRGFLLAGNVLRPYVV